MFQLDAHRWTDGVQLHRCLRNAVTDESWVVDGRPGQRLAPRAASSGRMGTWASGSFGLQVVSHMEHGSGLYYSLYL